MVIIKISGYLLFRGVYSGPQKRKKNKDTSSGLSSDDKSRLTITVFDDALAGRCDRIYCVDCLS